MNSSPGSSVNGAAAVSLADTAPRRSDSASTNGDEREHHTGTGMQPSNKVLVSRWDDSTIDEFVRFIEKHGFEVHCTIGSSGNSASIEYGAIIHLARSDRDLRAHLGDDVDGIANEEWVLIAGDAEQDFHCTFQLTEHASDELRAFVHWLWAIGSVA